MSGKRKDFSSSLENSLATEETEAAQRFGGVTNRFAKAHATFGTPSVPQAVAAAAPAVQPLPASTPEPSSNEPPPTVETTPSAAEPLRAAPAPRRTRTAKIRRVQETVSLTGEEFDQLVEYRLKAAKKGEWVNKSTILRAGLVALSRLPDDERIDLITTVPEIKRGPEKKDE